jgi:hypothetical protein
MGHISDDMISRLSINKSVHEFFHIILQPISITHIHISLVSVRDVNFVLFNSMLKYVINRLMHAFFYFRTVIIHRPILTLGLKLSGRYHSFRMITILIYACLFPFQDCCHPSADIDPWDKALWPISLSRDDNSPDMEKDMH